MVAPTARDLFVKEITATCSSSAPEIKRIMKCIDLESAEKWGSEVEVTMPAIEGVGTGDVLSMLIGFKMDAAEHVVQRALEMSAEEKKEEDDDDAY